MTQSTSRVFGYCRISKPTQKIDRQIRTISAAYPNAIIYKETFTGTKMIRGTEWLKLEKRLR